VSIIEDVLLSHEKVSDDGPRARFTNFGESALEIEVFSYIAVSDFAESTTVRQELLLSIYERLSAAGIGIAFPTRTLFFARKSGDDQPRQSGAEPAAPADDS
jgi:MscS family membrane protein